MSFDWTRWPYDPEAIHKRVIDEAAQALKDTAHDGMRQVERALGALDVSLGMVQSRIHDQHGDTLAKLDRAHRDIRQKLEQAMDEVYSAAHDADNI